MRDISHLLHAPRPKVDADDRFGACPVCGDCTRTLNVGSNHWFVCDNDLTKWWIGSNLFSARREENEEIWRRNAEELAGIVEVRPLYGDDSGRAS